MQQLLETDATVANKGTAANSTAAAAAAAAARPATEEEAKEAVAEAEEADEEVEEGVAGSAAGLSRGNARLERRQAFRDALSANPPRCVNRNGNNGNLRGVDQEEGRDKQEALRASQRKEMKQKREGALGETRDGESETPESRTAPGAGEGAKERARELTMRALRKEERQRRKESTDRTDVLSLLVEVCMCVCVCVCMNGGGVSCRYWWRCVCVFACVCA